MARELAGRGRIDDTANRPAGGRRFHRRLASQPEAQADGVRVRVGQVRRQLTWSIVADGGIDRMLVPIIEWTIHRLDPDLGSEFIAVFGSHHRRLYIATGSEVP